MGHEVLPPDAGPWRGARPSVPTDVPMVGPYGALNPYAPPSKRADRSSVPALASIQPRLASPSQRLLAKLIDVVLLALALTPGILVSRLWGTSPAVAVCSLGLLAIAGFQWTITATRGQTLGKRWIGLRVVTREGERVGFLRGVFLRVWVMWVVSLGMSGGLWLLLEPFLVFSKQGRTLHDHLAKTLVIVAGTPGDPYPLDLR